MHTIPIRKRRIATVAALAAVAVAAPASAQGLQTPVQIFVQLGLWRSVVGSSEAALETNGRPRSGEETNGRPAESRSDFNALASLAYGNLMLRRFERAARNLSRAREAVERHPDTARMDGYLEMRARHVVETQRWPDVTVRSDRTAGGFEVTVPGLKDTDTSTHGSWLYAAGTALAAQGRVRPATAVETQLERLARQRELDGESRAANALLVMSAELSASVALREGRVDDAVHAARQASELGLELPARPGPPLPVKPAPELYGEVLLETGRAGEAAAAFEQALQRMPKRTPSLLGLARAHEAQGNAAAAREVYNEIATMPGVRAGSAAVREAREFPAASSGHE